MKILYKFLFLLLPFCAPTSLTAQDESTITCRVLYLNAPPGAPKAVHLFDGQSAQEITLPGMNFSPVYELPAETTRLTLLPEAPVEGEELPEGAPTIALQGARHFYLLITSDEQNKVLPIAAHLAATNLTEFTTGDMLWFNLTEVYVAGQVGTEKLALKPQANRILSAPTDEKGNYPVNLAYQVKRDKPVYPICETSWVHDPRMRKVAFVFTENGRRAPRVLAFNDYRPEKKP